MMEQVDLVDQHLMLWVIMSAAEARLQASIQFSRGFPFEPWVCIASQGGTACVLSAGQAKVPVGRACA
jgi:hypothetical protein